MERIDIFTDGSALGNPGPGGYGIIVDWVGKNYTKEYSRGFRHTTNNRMELLAIIEALELLRKHPLAVTIYSDSKYVVEAVEKKWVFGWAKKRFKDKKNPDLWKRFLTIYPKHHVKSQWAKGHNNHPQNERCDRLAVFAAKNDAIAIDEFYEQSIQKK